MFRNMAASMIRTMRIDEDDDAAPKNQGRIVTTVPKAKELRPFIEKLITLAKRAKVHEEKAEEFAATAERNSAEWQKWRESDQWQKWSQARAPIVALRRTAFSRLRDNEAVDILFDELAEKFEDRPGGYTRIVRLATRRLGDGGQQALIEFVGENDRTRRVKSAAPMVTDDEPATEEADATEEAPAEEAESTDEVAETTADESAEAASEDTASEEEEK
ncbi:50S ribosomal protein L17 [Calycomorphotria hydatis]|uniref:50S ribosomal protein L17 n=2 Tax=Calycomorphotria hydatis TaxID=2528027 RepID=A0A517T879_9PLAN|nr:50S ribosomal protein L17 [Calycomorphotria hydatis]